MSRKRKSIDSTEEIKVEDITYLVFFHKCLVKGLVKPWQEREIHAFFKGLGLKDKEPVDTYKDALAKY